MKQVVLQKAPSGRIHVRKVLAAALLCVSVAVALFAAPAPAHAATSRYDAVKASVPVDVAFTGSGADKAGSELTSTFTMTPAEGETVAPTTETLSVKGSGTAAFSLSFNEVGEHNYTVTQTTKDAENWTTDRSVYAVTVYCMWDESTDTLFTTVVIKDEDGTKDESCLFENAYKAPAQPTKPAVKPAGGMPQTGDAQLYVALGVCAAGLIAAGAGIWSRRRANER